MKLTRKIFAICLLVLSIGILNSCNSKPVVQQSPPPPQPPAPAKPDPLEEARKELFNEIGITEDGNKIESSEPVEPGAETEKPADLPVVSPAPPELPAGEADLSDIPVK
jgi:hypothetical protein